MKKKKHPLFYDISSKIDVRLLAIKVETPKQEDCDWKVGLTDNKGTPPLNYFQCENVNEASEVLETILREYNGVSRGEDFGVDENRVFVYVECSS